MLAAARVVVFCFAAVVMVEEPGSPSRAAGERDADSETDASGETDAGSEMDADGETDADSEIDTDSETQPERHSQ